MEPVTHVLMGACLARTGLNRRAAYTTLAMAVGAELPDIDTLWGLGGPVTGFEHHRGITHTFFALPVEAALVVALVYGWHRWRLHRDKTAGPAPVNWSALYAFTLIALLSHLFLDYTNNYGIRPFFPFNPHWYAASIVFIFDPLIFLLLLSALVLPLLFGLVGAEVGERKPPFVARGWSIAALLLIVVVWTLREVEHNRAVQLAAAQTYAQAAPAADSPAPESSQDAPPVYLQARRVLASPDPISPFRWYTVTDYGSFYQLGTADTLLHTFEPAQQVQPKLEPSAAWLAAEQSFLGRVYVDWSPMPFVTIAPAGLMGTGDDGRTTSGHTVVTFADPRFMGSSPFLHRSGRSPLTGKVELDVSDRVVAEQMDGKPQRVK